MDILEDLKYRGLIHQATNLEGLKKRLKKGKIVLYCGFDPTAKRAIIRTIINGANPFLNIFIYLLIITTLLYHKFEHY